MSYILTGFFNLRSYRLLCESLWKFSKLPEFKLKLLFGKEAIRQDQDSKNFEDRIEDLSLELPVNSVYTNMEQK